ncbi:hypothetical protein DPMN_194006 [Dreissena polymorpha]|uniref:Uncharacterized protein n=1 Tax=Dreissena polymorpha TaxID=45954 RepID=A0A9D4BCL4_DREPO|nr:hypothetical protein DPMN_194006 [Dreissena polymorpha]
MLKRVNHTLTSANGGSLEILGKTKLDFEIDNELFSYEFLVAELDEISAILGEDFLEEFDVYVKFGKSVMQIGKHKIRLMRNENNKVARIRLSDSATIPAESI